MDQTKDPQKLWTDRGRQALISLLKGYTQLTKVKMFADKKKMTAQDKLFVEEINFYTDMKSGNKKKKEKFGKILEQCDAEFMFAKLLKKVQKEDD